MFRVFCVNELQFCRSCGSKSVSVLYIVSCSVPACEVTNQERKVGTSLTKGTLPFFPYCDVH
jgi:hypothetical protein